MGDEGAENQFQRLPDDVVLNIFDKVSGIKWLCRSFVVSKRFASLIPRVQTASINSSIWNSNWLSCSDSSNEKENPQGLSFLGNFSKFVDNLVFEPLRFLQLKQIQSLSLEIVFDFNGDHDSVFKWGAKLTSELDSVTFLYAESLSEMSILLGYSLPKFGVTLSLLIRETSPDVNSFHVSPNLLSPKEMVSESSQKRLYKSLISPDPLVEKKTWWLLPKITAHRPFERQHWDKKNLLYAPHFSLRIIDKGGLEVYCPPRPQGPNYLLHPWQKNLADVLISSATPANVEVTLSLKKALISLTAFAKLFVDSYLLQEIVERKIRIALCSIRLTVARRKRSLIITITDWNNKGVKLCLAGEKLVECRNTFTMGPMIFSERAHSRIPEIKGGHVPVLLLPISGHLMKGVTIVNFKTSDHNFEANTAMLDSFAEQQDLFLEAVVQILEKHKDCINALF
ncbi:hypothetical protein Vadar_021085 [Vaccinium darrowii]|uniref:Uncharacterized protein n=1 Tax=Vaccinium darrowii TaxID=229202 RepID=A0ACB7XBF4_9ERIC|nr:hypothetical protein Vadar_021085 [Vaccinium darrowii]